jgi:molybdopterin converting factor small subunit
VKENENGSYPPFIKLRRPSLDKYASDNVLLYEFAGTRPIDVTKPKLGVMPVYKLVLPNSTQIKAGTYWYDMINPVDADPIGYDINTVEKLDLYFDENGVVREDVSSKKELLDKFIETLDQSGIYLNEDEMIERIKTEFDNHDYAIKPTELEKAVNFALKKLKNKDSEQDKSKKSTSRKQTGTKEEKKPIESNGVTFTESTGGYAKRTEENAEWSDITLALAVDFTSRGELKTAEAAGAEVDRKEKTIKPGGKYM